MSDLDSTLSYHSANRQTDLVNERGAATEDAKVQDLEKSRLLGKVLQKSDVSTADATKIPKEQEKLGGAFYLPVKGEDVATWKLVIEALESMEDCDINVDKEITEEFNAYGLQYYHDTFALARTRLCQLEKADGTFLEIHRMEGDGFVFADEFKKKLTEKLGDSVEDVETVEPIAAESATDSFLNYLDLSNEAVATDMIRHWLSALKPKGGVKYDHRQIYETLSSLGWNCTEEANFKALSDYSDHIVGPVLEILRHPETLSVPTAYFGAMCLEKFVQEGVIPEAMKTFKTVSMLFEVLEKFWTEAPPYEHGKQGAAGLQVTRSRQVLRLLLSTIQKLSQMVSDVPAEMPESVTKVLTALADTEADAITELTLALNLTPAKGAEEDVSAA